MITIVEGNPGSGKSFFGVNYILTYCTYDEMYQEFVLREDVLIISNVEGLRVKHLNLEDLIKKYTVESFFTVDNFERIQKQYKVKNIILIFDEAQKHLDSKFYDKNVFYFFQYHRHLGLDVFLLTQSRTTLARQLIPLCEYVVQAKPRSKGVGGTFSYYFLDPKGAYMYSKTLKASQKVFRAYKSFTVDETNKPKNILKHYLIMGLVLAVGLFACTKYVFSWFKVRSQMPPSSSSIKGNIPPRLAPSSFKSYSVSRSTAVLAVPPTYTHISTGTNNVPLPSPSINRLIVRGSIQSGKDQVLLLSDGSMPKSRKHYKLGDTYTGT